MAKYRVNPAPRTIYRHELPKILKRWWRHADGIGFAREMEKKAWEAAGEEPLEMRYRLVKTPDAAVPWDLVIEHDGWRTPKHDPATCRLMAGEPWCDCPYEEPDADHRRKTTRVFEEFMRPMWLEGIKAAPWNITVWPTREDIEYFYDNADGFEIKVDLGKEALIEWEDKVKAAKRKVTRRTRRVETERDQMELAKRAFEKAKRKLAKAQQELEELEAEMGRGAA